MKRVSVVIILTIVFLISGCLGDIGPFISVSPTKEPANSVTPGVTETVAGTQTVETQTVMPSNTATQTVAPTPTVTQATQEPTVTITEMPTESPTLNVTPTPELTPKPTPTPTPTPTPKPTPIPTPTPTPKPTPTPTPTPQPHPTPDITPGPMLNQLINPDGNTIAERFLVPEGFERVPVEQGSFAEFLRNLPLKQDGSLLHYINRDGSIGGLVPENIYSTPAAHAAILEIKMLSSFEQCADTVMHLYAEYLYANQRYDEMVFTTTDGNKCDFNRYTSGYRYKNGKWTYNKDNYTGTERRVFELWMDSVFLHCNTTSLERYDSASADISDIQIGDMFNQPKTGSIPVGHVVMVCDIIKNPTTGEVRFMTLQGSMPAVEAHIMLNAKEPDMSPWQNTVFPDGKFTSATYWSCDITKLCRFKLNS